MTESMHDQHRRELLNIAQLYGISGIVKVLAEWCEREGGLKFVREAVNSPNRDTE